MIGPCERALEMSSPMNILYFNTFTRPIYTLSVDSPCTENTSKVTEKL